VGGRSQSWARNWLKNERKRYGCIRPSYRSFRSQNWLKLKEIYSTEVYSHSQAGQDNIFIPNCFMDCHCVLEKQTTAGSKCEFIHIPLDQVTNIVGGLLITISAIFSQAYYAFECCSKISLLFPNNISNLVLAIFSLCRPDESYGCFFNMLVSHCLACINLT